MTNQAPNWSNNIRQPSSLMEYTSTKVTDGMNHNMAHKMSHFMVFESLKTQNV